MRTFLVNFVIAANLLLVDVATKEAALKSLGGGNSRTVVEGFFDLVLVKNHGCAWGMLQGQVWPLAVFAALALVVLAWKRRTIFGVETLRGDRRVNAFAARAAECMLYAGIAGNLIDRVFRGFVVDMLDFHWGVHHFPCFNVADAYISVAAAILVLLSFRDAK